MARSTVGYSDRIIDLSTMERRLFLMGAGDVRICERRGLSGGLIRGVLFEVAAVQLQLRSMTLATWTNLGVATITPGAGIGPDGITSVPQLHVGVGAGNSIYYSMQGSVCAASAPLALCLWIKRVSTSGVLRPFQIQGAAYGDWNINLAALPDEWVEVTLPSGLVTQITPWVATAASSGGTILSAAAGTVDFLAWYAGLEAGAFCSSPIATAGGVVTRTSDTAIYWTNPSPNAIEKHIQIRFLLPSHTPLADIDICELTNAAGDYLRLKAVTGTGNLAVVSSDTGTAEIATSLTDGEIHVVDIEVGPSYLRAYLDGVASAIDTSAVVPTGLDRIQMDVCGGIIGYMRVWDRRFRELPAVNVM